MTPCVQRFMCKMLNSNLGLGSISEALQLCTVKLTHRSPLGAKNMCSDFLKTVTRNSARHFNFTYLIYRQTKAPICTQHFHCVSEHRFIFQPNFNISRKGNWLFFDFNVTKQTAAVRAYSFIWGYEANQENIYCPIDSQYPLVLRQV